MNNWSADGGQEPAWRLTASAVELIPLVDADGGAQPPRDTQVRFA